MTSDMRIVRNGRRIPVVAFFGTKGGVGKTTIARLFAELVTVADSAPNVLLVDVDVHNRGMTVEMTKETPVSCKTIHDYITSKNVSDVEALDVTHMVRRERANAGRLFFIPASTPEADHVFDESAKIGPERLLDILFRVVDSAAKTYDCECVVIDCGPIIDPYTAAGAQLADREFIIGQNEAISFANLRIYPDRIREFYPEFRTSKMKLIVNKVHGWERLEERRLHEDIFMAIPFTIDIVEISEGLESINEMQILLFEDHIAQIVEKTLQADHAELIPPRKALLPKRWESLVSNADQLAQAPFIKRLGMMRLLLPIGLLAILVGGFLFYAGSTTRHRAQNVARATEICQVLKAAIAKLPSVDDPAAAQLKDALVKAERADPSDDHGLDEVVTLAEAAGVAELPSVRPLDPAQENVGIGLLLVGVVVTVIGFSCSRSRQRYLLALQGLRKQGTKWLMEEMKSKGSARKTFDKLLKVSQRLGD